VLINTLFLQFLVKKILLSTSIPIRKCSKLSWLAGFSDEGYFLVNHWMTQNNYFSITLLTPVDQLEDGLCQAQASEQGSLTP